MRNRVFFPQASLDQWGVEGKIELTPTELVLLSEGRRYEITEVVRVVVEVTGSIGPVLSPADGDVYDWAVPWDQWLAGSALD